jgi:hypothetical protein
MSTEKNNSTSTTDQTDEKIEDLQTAEIDSVDLETVSGGVIGKTFCSGFPD